MANEQSSRRCGGTRSPSAARARRWAAASGSYSANGRDANNWKIFKILRLIRLGRLQDSSMVATRLAPRRMYLCASPAYLAHHGAPHSLSELPRHNCLIGSSDSWDFQQNGREIAIRVHGNWRCNSGKAVLEAALLGFGLCQLPDYYVREHLRGGTLRSLLEQHQPPHTAVWALYPQQRHLSPKVRQLIEHLRDGLASRAEYQEAL